MLETFTRGQQVRLVGLKFLSLYRGITSNVRMANWKNDLFCLPNPSKQNDYIGENGDGR